MKVLQLKYLVFFAILSFAFDSCFSIDDFYEKDKVERVTMYVASEPGTYIEWTGDEYEGLCYKEKGWTDWSCYYFEYISGFTYERGYEYELLVEKTTLANPYADGGYVEYKLIEIVSKEKVTD